MKLSEIIAELKAESSTNAKKAILEQHRHNKALELLFFYTYSPRIKFWIKAPKSVDKSSFCTLTQELLEDVDKQLNGRLITGNAARNYLESLLVDLQPAEQEILIRMVNRDMDCKVSLGTINKVWKNLIPEFPVMLAEKFNAKTGKAFYDAETQEPEHPKIVVQKKSDGGRAEVIFSADNSIQGYSRNGSELQLLDTFSQCIDFFRGYVIDGEIVFKDPKTGKFADRKTSNGLFNKLVRNTISKEELSNLHFCVWDMIPEADFLTGKCNIPYRERLETLIAAVGEGISNISVIETNPVHTVADAQTFYQRMLAEKEEGAMLKLLDSPWESDRVNHVLKLKEERDAALLCVNILPHKKNPDWIGSLECVSSCGKIAVSIGSGLTEEDRKKDPSYFIGKIIDLKFNDILLAKNSDTYSLFLPIYFGIRTDKAEADTLTHLLQ